MARRSPHSVDTRPIGNYYETLAPNAVIKISPSVNGDAFREQSRLYLDNMENTAVRAPLPEAITIGLGNVVGQTWDFWKIVKGGAVTSATLGVSANKGVAERQFWQEIEPKDVTTELTFNAYRSAKDDVYLPCQMLLKYAAASDASNSVLDFSWRRPAYIDVRIGRIATYYECIIRSVDVVYSNKIDTEGYPISATVSLTFITRDPIGWKQVEAWTNGAGQVISPFDVAADQVIGSISAVADVSWGGLKMLVGGIFAARDPNNAAAVEQAAQLNQKDGSGMNE